MVRLTNEQYAQLVALAKRAKCPVATFCRKVIEGALEEGIQVVARPYGEGDTAR
jgi:predicted DNA-binding protein